MNGELAMCQGKKTYISYAHARQAAYNVNRHNQHAKANVYRCDSCHQWHVGNTLGGNPRRRRLPAYTAEERRLNGRVELPE